MTARMNCIHYRGILDQVNGAQNDIYAAANLISQADFVALQVPFTIVNNTLTMSNFTSTFFQALRQAGVPVWVHIDCFTGYPDSVAAIAGIKANMALYYSWFLYFLELDLLAGFWLNNFGFDVTFPGPSPTNALKFVRLDQNHIIDISHLTYSKPVYIKCTNPSDAITLVGPNYGAEIDIALTRSSLGRQPTMVDWLCFNDPVANWTSLSPLYETDRLSYYLTLAKEVANFGYINIATIQHVNLTTTPFDGLLGLNFPTNIQAKMVDFSIFLRMLGFGPFGMVGIAEGVGDNKWIDPDYWNASNILDNVSGYSNLFSREGFYHVVNNELIPVVASGIPTPIPTQIFDSTFHLTSLAYTSAASSTTLVATLVQDTDYSAVNTDTFIEYVTLTTAREVTLAPAISVPVGNSVVIADKSGNASSINTITPVPLGTDALYYPVAISSAFGFIELFSNGTDAWLLEPLPAQMASIGQQPSGRLTLVSGVPILASVGGIAGATTVFFTPYLGNLAPFWNGTSWNWSSFTELSQALTNPTLSPGVALPNSVYDIFLWKNGAIPVISRGPPWTTTTTRGTGAGTTQLQIVNGFLCNAVGIANGPLAGYGLWIGTVATNAAGTIDFIYGSSGTGGIAASFGIFNYFNRQQITTSVIDSGANYTYATLAIRPTRNSLTNRVTWVSGIAEDFIAASYRTRVTTVAAASFTLVGLSLDATNSFSSLVTITTSTANPLDIVETSFDNFQPLLGLHFIQAVEEGDGTHANTLNGNLDASLTVTLNM